MMRIREVGPAFLSGLYLYIRGGLYCLSARGPPAKFTRDPKTGPIKWTVPFANHKGVAEPVGDVADTNLP